MAVQVTCPGCKSMLTLADEMRGKKVRCKKCETVLRVPDVAKRKRDEEEEEPKKTAPIIADDEPDDEEEDDRPARKKKKKKSKKGVSPLLIVIPVFVVILLVVGGLSAFLLTRNPGPGKQPPQAQAPVKGEEEVQKPQIFNKIRDGNPTKQGGKGIVSSIRGAVYRAERKVELANINKMYAGFILETPRGQQTLENYLNYIQRDYKPVHDAIKEGYYVINMKAQGGNDIVAGERDLDQTGHLAVFFTGDVSYVPEADWKKAMGIK